MGAGLPVIRRPAARRMTGRARRLVREALKGGERSQRQRGRNGLAGMDLNAISGCLGMKERSQLSALISPGLVAHGSALLDGRLPARIRRGRAWVCLPSRLCRPRRRDRQEADELRRFSAAPNPGLVKCPAFEPSPVIFAVPAPKFVIEDPTVSARQSAPRAARSSTSSRVDSAAPRRGRDHRGSR
jgi:hypothetical protein